MSNDLFNLEKENEIVYDEEGYDKDGFDNEGYNRNGIHKCFIVIDGYDAEGYDVDGYNRDGWDRFGYNNEGYDKNGYDKYGHDRDGYDKDGYNRQGYDKCGYDKAGYDRNGYDQNGYRRSGYNRNGYDRDGHSRIYCEAHRLFYESESKKVVDDRKENNSVGRDAEGFDIYGYDEEGYDRQGYNHLGHNCLGYNRKGYDEEGYNRNGFNIDGFTKGGYNHAGYDRDGYDKDGYDRRGFDRNRMQRNRSKFDKAGYDYYGYDKSGYDKNGYNKNGYDKDGFDNEGYNRNGIHKCFIVIDGYDAEGYDVDGYDRDGWDRFGYNNEGYDKNGYNIRGYDRDGYNITGYNREGYDRRGFDKNMLHRNNSRFDEDGYDYYGYDENGYDIDGYDCDGWDRFGYNNEGYDKNGYNIRGYDRDGYNITGYNREGYDRRGFDKNMLHRNNSRFDEDGYDYYGYDESGYDRDGYNITGYNREGYDRRGFDKNMLHRNNSRFDEDGYDYYGYDENGYDIEGYDREGNKKLLEVEAKIGNEIKLDDKSQKNRKINREKSDSNGLTNEDIKDLYSVRNIYFTHKFSNYYKKATSRVKQNIDAIIENFRTLEGDEFHKYLKQKNNKALVGVKHNFDKIYVENSSGHRLIWCRAEEIMIDCKPDAIVVIAYVDDHDKGQSREGRNFDDNAEFVLAYQEAEELYQEGIEDFENRIPPYLFYKGRLIPQLNCNQKSYLEITPPLMLQGCAGSGKTQVSLEIFSKLAQENKAPIYITFTRELVDDVKAKIAYMPDMESSNAEERIFTLTDFYLKCLGLKRSNITLASQNYFMKWKAERYIHKKNQKHIDMDSEIAWTYIRGVIKGGAITEEIPDRESFSKWMNQKEGIDNEDADIIYDIYMDYERHLQEKSIYDDNMLAEQVLKHTESGGIYESLIVDEVQDLTYVQIRALIHCVKDYNIYLCGDINQRVNPTIIDLDATKSLFYENGSSALRNVYLGSSFRSGPGLVSFLNYISGLRRTYIALQGQETEAEETSLRKDDEGLWATICDEEKVDIAKVCNLAIESANCIVITPDKYTAEKLVRNNSKLDGRVKTVQEMKGLEYDNVILYDFISHREHDFSEIFNLQRKKDTWARLLFNLLYVACTRAKDRLIVCESSCNKELKNLVYKDITHKESVESVRGFMQMETDDEGWFNEAGRLEELQKFDMAIRAYQMVYDINCGRLIERCKIMADVVAELETNQTEYLQLLLNESGHRLVELEEYEYATRIYGYLDNYCNVVNINGIYAKSKAKQHLSHEYVQRVISNSTNKDVYEGCEKLFCYADNRIEVNKNYITSIKKMMEEINNGK